MVPTMTWVTHTADYGSYVVYRLNVHEWLERDAEEWLIAGLTDAFPDLKITEYFAERREMLRTSDHISVAVAEPGGRFAGFLSSRWQTGEAGVADSFLHASVFLLAEQFRRTQLFRHMWRVHLDGLMQDGFGFPWVVALKTYNPAVYAALRTFTRVDGVKLYPRIADGVQDEAMASMAAAIKERIAPELIFDPSTGAIEGAGVPRDFYAARPSCRSDDVERYFAQHLREGDRILCVLDFPRSELVSRRVLKMFGLAAVA